VDVERGVISSATLGRVLGRRRRAQARPRRPSGQPPERADPELAGEGICGLDAQRVITSSTRSRLMLGYQPDANSYGPCTSTTYPDAPFFFGGLPDLRGLRGRRGSDGRATRSSGTAMPVEYTSNPGERCWSGPSSPSETSRSARGSRRRSGISTKVWRHVVERTAQLSFAVRESARVANCRNRELQESRRLPPAGQAASVFWRPPQGARRCPRSTGTT